MNELMQIIQDNILDLLDERNISMRQLSADIDCSDSYIQKMLNGKLVPGLDKLTLIAEYFGIPVWRLFLSEELANGKLQQIESYLLTFDEETLDATLTMVRRIQPEATKK